MKAAMWASRIALEVVQEWAKTQASPQSDLGPMKRLAVLTELAEEANQRIYTAAEDSGKARGMGDNPYCWFCYLQLPRLCSRRGQQTLRLTRWKTHTDN